MYIPLDATGETTILDAYTSHPQFGSFTNIVQGTMGGTLSNNKLEKVSGVSLNPNPTNGVVTIKNTNNTSVDVTVFDLNGRALLKSTNSRIDISNFAAGLYVFRVKTDNGQLVKRILKN